MGTLSYVKTLVVALLLVFCTACGSAGGGATEPRAGKTSPSIDVPSTPAPITLSTSIVSIDLRVKQKQCYGDAGCNVTYTTTLGLPTFAEGNTLDGDYDVTYEVTGPEDGPAVDTISLSSDLKYVPPDDVSLSVPSAKTVLKAKVTGVTRTDE